MPRVKVVFSESWGSYDYYADREIYRDCTGWEEITDDELELLRKNLPRIYDGKLVPKLIIEDELGIQDRILTVKEALEAHKKRKEARLHALEAKRQQKAAMKIAQKKAALEKLKAELKEAGERV